MKKSFLFALLLSALLIACGTQETSSKTATAGDQKKISYQELLQQDEELLTTYKLVDADTGIYRIPVDRAIEILAAEHSK